MTPITPKRPQNARIWPKIALGREFSDQTRKALPHPPRAHFIGIGGIGVSALARYFSSQGWQVSGSDRVPSALLQELKAEGIKIQIGQYKKNLSPKPHLVIYTQATPRDNPELRETKRLKIKSLSYPEALSRLTRKFTTIAIAGTHGKSTTTALAAVALIQAKMDPTVIIGTKVPQLKGKNFRLGKSKYLVVEADEYKDAFLNYFPTAALITNIDREHLDYFKNLTQTRRSFKKFIDNLDENSVLVLNKDSSPLLSLGKQLRQRIIWYSIKEKSLAKKIKKHLKIPGEHNLSNALGVYKLARALGVKEKDILTAFSKYHGSWRRFEYKGRFTIRDLPFTVPIYDDYAHHPTEIKATLAAFREKFPQSAGWQIICVFQPHQAERLKKLLKDFTSAFDAADALVLLDVFKVTGREHNSKINSSVLAEAIKKRKKPKEIIYLSSSSRLRLTLNKIIDKKSVIVMMGAGDIVNLTPRLLK